MNDQASNINDLLRLFQYISNQRARFSTDRLIMYVKLSAAVYLKISAEGITIATDQEFDQAAGLPQLRRQARAPSPNQNNAGGA